MKHEHYALVRQWQEEAERKDDMNYRFLRSLKMVDEPEFVDEVAGETHREVFEQIDCVRCANCCKTMRPGLAEEDIDRLASRLEKKRDEFIDTYLEVDPEGGEEGFRTKSMPCPFLGDDGRCQVYEDRPKACQGFPHTNKSGFIWRTSGVSANALICPATFHIVERMRQRLGRKRRHRHSS